MYHLTEYALTRTWTDHARRRISRGKADTLEEENALAWNYIEWTICHLTFRLSTSRIIAYFQSWQHSESRPRQQRANAYAIRRPQQVLDRLEERGLVKRIRGGVMPSRQV